MRHGLSRPDLGMLTGAEPVSKPEETTPMAIDSHRDGCSASYSRLLSLNCSSISSIVEVSTDSIPLLELFILATVEQRLSDKDARDITSN